MTKTIAALMVAIGAGLGTACAETVRVDEDLTLHYEAAGDGETTLLFIPGWTMSAQVFSRQLAHYEGSNDVRAVAYDPRGQGRSTKTPEGHTYAQRGRDVAAFIEALDLDRIVLVGWSYGVLDLLAYVDQFGPDRLVGVVLIDGTPLTVGDDNATDWVWYRRDDADGYRRWTTMAVLEDRQAFNVEFATWMLEDAEADTIAWLGEIAAQTPASVAALLNETASYVDYSEDLKALEGVLPLLYVMRAEWRETVTRWARSHTPSADVEAFGKHMMFWERPDEFNAVVDGFLQELRSPAN